MSNVEEAVRLWEVFREGTVAELGNIPEEHWDFRPGEGARSLRELALHIAGSGVGFTNELLAEDTSFMRLRDPKVQAELTQRFANVQSKSDIIDLLKTTGADSAARLRAAARDLETKTMSMMSGDQSRVSGIWFAGAHESYHRGQVATYARALGFVPAMTQRINAAKK